MGLNGLGLIDEELPLAWLINSEIIFLFWLFPESYSAVDGKNGPLAGSGGPLL